MYFATCILLQVALIQNMLQPATSAPVPTTAQADSVANDAAAEGHPAKGDASQEVVQVATVDSFQVTYQATQQLLQCVAVQVTSGHFLTGLPARRTSVSVSPSAFLAS